MLLASTIRSHCEGARRLRQCRPCAGNPEPFGLELPERGRDRHVAWLLAMTVLLRRPSSNVLWTSHPNEALPDWGSSNAGRLGTWGGISPFVSRRARAICSGVRSWALTAELRVRRQSQRLKALYLDRTEFEIPHRLQRQKVFLPLGQRCGGRRFCGRRAQLPRHQQCRRQSCEQHAVPIPPYRWWCASRSNPLPCAVLQSSRASPPPGSY